MKPNGGKLRGTYLYVLVAGSASAGTPAGSRGDVEENGYAAGTVCSARSIR